MSGSWTDQFTNFASNVQQAASTVVNVVQAGAATAGHAVQGGINAAQHAAGEAALNFQGAARRVAGGVQHVAQTGAKAVEALAQNGRRAARNAANAVQEAARHPGATADRMIDAAARAAHRGVKAAGHAVHAVEHGAEVVTHAVQGGIRTARRAAHEAVLDFQDAAQRVAGGVQHVAQTGAKAVEALAQNGRRAARNAAKAVQEAARHPGATADRMIDATAKAAHGAVYQAGRVVHDVEKGARVAVETAGDVAQAVGHDAGLAVKAVGVGVRHVAVEAGQAAQTVAHDVQVGAGQVAHGIQAVGAGVAHVAQDAAGVVRDVAGAEMGVLRQAGDGLAMAARGAQHVMQTAGDEVRRVAGAVQQHVGQDLIDAGHAVQGIHSPGDAARAVLGGAQRVGEDGIAAGKAVLGGYGRVVQTAATETGNVLHEGIKDVRADVQGVGHWVQEGMQHLGKDVQAGQAAVRGGIETVRQDINHGVDQLGQAAKHVGDDVGAVVHAGGQAVKHVAVELAHTELGQQALHTQAGQVVQTAAELAFAGPGKAKEILANKIMPGDVAETLKHLKPGDSTTIGVGETAKLMLPWRGIMVGGDGKYDQKVTIKHTFDKTTGQDGWDIEAVKSMQGNAAASVGISESGKAGLSAGLGESDSSTLHFKTMDEAVRGYNTVKQGIASDILQDVKSLVDPRIENPLDHTRNFMHADGKAPQGPRTDYFNPLRWAGGVVLQHVSDNVRPDAAAMQGLQDHVVQSKQTYQMQGQATVERPNVGWSKFGTENKGQDRLGGAIMVSKEVNAGRDGKAPNMTVSMTRQFTLDEKNSQSVKGPSAALGKGAELGMAGSRLKAGMQGSLTTRAQYDMTEQRAQDALHGRGGDGMTINHLLHPDAVGMNVQLTGTTANPEALLEGNPLARLNTTLQADAEVRHPTETARRMVGQAIHGDLGGAMGTLNKQAHVKAEFVQTDVSGTTYGTSFKAKVPEILEAELGGSVTNQTSHVRHRKTLVDNHPDAPRHAPVPAVPPPLSAPVAASAAVQAARQPTAEQDAWILEHFGVRMPDLMKDHP